MPLVSVIVLTLNSEKYITRCLTSLMQQTFSNFEVLIVDAGSKDNTIEIIKNFDFRFKLLELPNSDMGSARNYGINASIGKYITFLDSDDFYLSEKISRQYEFLEKNPDSKVVFCSAWHYRTGFPSLLGAKKFSSQPIELKDYLRGKNHNLNTMFANREIFESGLMFAEGALGRYGEEWRLQLKIALAEIPMKWVPEFLVVVEIRPDSHTNWSLQSLMKRHALDEIEGVSKVLSHEQLEKFQVNKIINHAKFKLVVSFLLNGEFAEAFDTAESLCNPIIKNVAKFIISLSKLFPNHFINKFLRWIWTTRQDLTFDWHEIPIELKSELENIILI
jgi:glycosyltransferase involved in cell wall biosynthesis